MRVLSHSDTHHLNRYMAWCGCHEILIQPSITFLFLANFSVYPTPRWFRWLSYSNHSFQLISIQYSVHHSDPARNHQSWYQKPFISTSNWRQAHIQRYISYCPSNKAREFIAIDSAPSFSLIGEIESARCSGKITEVSSKQQQIQKVQDDNCDKHRYCLARWFRAHILDRIQYVILCLLSFRIRCVVVSNTSSSPTPYLNANEVRTYLDWS